MNVTFIPVQMVVDEAEILTLAARIGFTVIVIGFDVAGLPVGQVALEVNTQLITSPVANAELE